MPMPVKRKGRSSSTKRHFETNCRRKITLTEEKDVPGAAVVESMKDFTPNIE